MIQCCEDNADTEESSQSGVTGGHPLSPLTPGDVTDPAGGCKYF